MSQKKKLVRKKRTVKKKKENSTYQLEDKLTYTQDAWDWMNE